MNPESESSIAVAVAELKTLGARIVEDAGRVQLVDLSESQFADEHTHLLQAFPEVRSLMLADTEITDAGLKDIVQLASLETLDLSTTQVTDCGLQHLAGLKKLDMLILGGCRIRDAGLAELSKLPMLRMLVDLIEHRERMAHLLDQYINGPGLTVVIGAEHTAPGLRPFSLIASTAVEGSTLRTVGLIGPTRMHYSRAIADRKSTRLNSSHIPLSRMPSSA